MILYTIYSPETVMETPPSEEQKYVSLDLEGRTLILEFSGNQARVVRLISVDPDDYLNPKYQPGTIFKQN